MSTSSSTSAIQSIAARMPIMAANVPPTRSIFPTNTSDHIGADSNGAYQEPDSCDGEDTASETSTIRHEHEPFQTFQHNAAELTASHFNQDLLDTKIERMRGETYNRVVGVTISAEPKKHNLKWLLSCFSRLKRNYNAAILKAVGSQLPLPIPEVVSFDLSCDNLLEKSYMFQKRLPGQTLTQLWDHLNRDQKKNVAKLVTDLVCQIATVEAPAGIVGLEHLSKIENNSIHAEKFCVPARGLGGGSFNKPNTWPAQPQSAEEHLLEQCERWRDYQLSQGVCFEEIWDALATISKSLGTRGFLDGPSVLSHGDLKPYDLLAEIRSPTEVKNTGVLDWDSAIIAPEFMAYRAPFWLWIPGEINSADEDDESTANFEPQTDEGRQLRDIFMLHASEKYKRLAFAPEALLARRMYTILQKGIFGPRSMMEAEHIIREWAELHPEDDVRPVDADSTER